MGGSGVVSLEILGRCVVVQGVCSLPRDLRNITLIREDQIYHSIFCLRNRHEVIEFRRDKRKANFGNSVIVSVRVDTLRSQISGYIDHSEWMQL